MVKACGKLQKNGKSKTWIVVLEQRKHVVILRWKRLDEYSVLLCQLYHIRFIYLCKIFVPRRKELNIRRRHI